VSVDGRRKLTVENHKGVEEFDGEKLTVRTSIGVLKIFGVSLVLEDLGCGSLLLTGEIRNIEWM
jgi:sporulation protein YqfC